MTEATKGGTTPRVIGMIGLGVMGEPICRNLAEKRAEAGVEKVIAFDLKSESLQRLAEYGVETVASVVELAEKADVVMMSLPSGDHVRDLAFGDDGLIGAMRPGQVLIDLGTTQPALSRELADRFAARNIAVLDAPVARTRRAAEEGKLLVMVGGAQDVFRCMEPVLRCFGSDVEYCGDHGTGQMAKILNNMVMFQTGVALAEALTIARKSGIDGKVLFEVLQKGSGDSFALRNHGMKAMLPGDFPTQAFSARYAAKDLDYALALAQEAGQNVRGAETARQILQDTIEQDYGDAYWPALIQTIDQGR